MSARSLVRSLDANRDPFQLKPLVACVRMAIAGGLLMGGIAPTWAELPIPLPGQGWVSSGNVAPPQIVDNGKTMRIDQTSDKAVLNWQKFDVGKDNTVDFNQPGESSVTLNRIIQPDQNPSRILGHITAKGQIYLVNKNGIVFGKDATVDTKTLVASSLNISDEVMQRGIIREFEKDGSPGQAALDGQTGDEQTQVNPESEIKVEAGAKIHAGKNGQVILAAPKVSNAGEISADEKGQIIMVASKDKVYLQPASSDSPFAGLLVEVGNGGKVENQAGGDIAVRQGNVTLAGFAVNQSGRVSATTSVNVNGSVRLLARENAVDDVFAGTHKLRATTTERDSDLGDGLGSKASVTFGNGSRTEIQADAAGGEAFDEQAQKPSYVEASASRINMESGSAIEAPNGKVSFTATDRLEEPVLGASGRIHLEQGARIDVSGKKDVAVDMERNVAEISVQTYNLRDAPYQKGGVLQGAKVKVDIRKDTEVLDASGGKTAIKRGIDERLTEGGEIDLTSSGDVIVNDGAVADISGGSLSYQDGYIDTTKLVDAAGRIVDISDADPDQTYVSIFGVADEAHPKWGQSKTWTMQGPQGAGRFEQGYREGRDAGSLNIQSPLTAWNGRLLAGSEQGLYQREKPASGGAFTINQADNSSSRANLFLSSQNVLFQSQSLPVSVALDQAFPGTEGGTPANLILSTQAIRAAGVSRLVVKSGATTTITNNAQLELPARGELRLDAKNIDVDGSAYAPGGSISLNSVEDVHLHDGSSVDVSGRWVNDYQTPSAAGDDVLVTDAGSVRVKATENLDFSAGAEIKADGGAWLDASGAHLDSGNGGGIELSAGTATVDGVAHVAGKLSGYGLEQGGKLTLTSNKVTIGRDANDNDALNLDVVNGEFNIAQQLGFAELNLHSNQGAVTVKGSTDLTLSTHNRLLDNSYRSQPSGKSVAGFSSVTRLADHLRHPLTLSLNGYGGVNIQTGSRIRADKGSNIQIEASNIAKGIEIDGSLEALGGSINVLLNAEQGGPYDATQSIWLGEHALLSVRGTSRLNPDDALGRTTGDVLAGGNVSLQARRGYLVMAHGSEIDVSGSNASLDVPVADAGGQRIDFERKTIGSDAGEIRLSAAEGMLLDGGFAAHAGGPVSRNGTLDLTLSRKFRNEPEDEFFPDGSMRFNVVQHARQTLPADLRFGGAIGVGRTGQATLAADSVAQAGFDALRLTVEPQFDRVTSEPLAPGEIRFLGDVSLGLASGIQLDAQTIAWSPLSQNTGTVKLDTAYLNLGSSAFNTVSGSSNKGNGKLIANTRWTQLTGSALLNGFKQVDFNSQHDLRMVGVRLGGERAFTGELKTAADVNLRASQIYPSTLTDYTIRVTDPNGKIHVSASAERDPTPLAAAGHLTLNAATIAQDGILKAPLGTVDLNAGKRLSFGPQSLTSVSADGQVIPLGSIANNLWKYALGADGNLVFNEAPRNVTLGEKHFNVKAPEIAFQPGSVVDVSGGGDLQAVEFQPGLGGSADYLNAKSGFAVLPALGAGMQPYDHNLSADFAYPPGSTIFLGEGSGLPSGHYTILPAQYALLPGAYLLTPVSASQDQTVTRFNTAGLPIVSGYLAEAGSGARDARSSGFLVENREQVLKRSQYDIRGASEFFRERAQGKNLSAPLLPVDAGQVSIDASTQLILEGQFKVDAGQGLGAKMDIAARHIQVVDELAANPSPGVLQILDDNLSHLHVDSLLLGGTRRFNNASGTTDLTVTADEVVIAANAKLAMLDFVAAANDSISVAGGAEISSSGNVKTGDKVINVSGDGALLRVSADEQVSVNRTASSGVRGNLTIQPGAVLKASKSMLLDSSLSSVLNGNIVMNGGALSLTAKTINLGDIGAQPGNALNLSNDQLLGLAVDDLLLTSRGSINLFGNVGKATGNGYDAIAFKHLVLDAAALSGFDNAGKTAKIHANSIELKNSHQVVAGASGTGSGELQLSANQFVQGQGTLGINGFQNVKLTVSAERADQTSAAQYTVSGDARLNMAANLSLSAEAVSVLDGHHLTIDGASGPGYRVEIAGNGSTDRTIGSGLGGGLDINAKSIDIHAAQLSLPSASLKLKAQNGIVIDGDSSIDLGGRALNFADKVVYSPGGGFYAETGQGNVQVSDEVALNIASGGGNAQGGDLVLKASAGNVNFAAHLTAKGGSAHLDMADYAIGASFDGLMNKMLGAGISDSIYFRVRDADIAQAAGQRIQAKQIYLVADRGDIDVRGRIVADAAGQGGRVALQAGGKITLQGSGSVSAKGGKTGGDVLFSSLGSVDPANGGIAIQSGAVIDVAGANTASGGEVVFSALRTGNGLNIQPVAGTVRGYNNFYAEGVQRYANDQLGNDATIDQGNIDTILTETSNYMNAASANVATLANGMRLRPGVEIDYRGDLALATAWDLSAARYGQQAGELTLRASGDLNITHDLSDGFSGGALQSGNSWSMRLVAGADSSADRLATAAGDDLMIGSNASIHTGSGDINAVAGGNIVFTDQTSTLYNAGRTDAGNPRGTLDGTQPTASLSYLAAGDYPVAGGDLTLRAGAAIKGAVSNQFIDQWMHRQGYYDAGFGEGDLTAWNVDASLFQQNVGSFGGGRVSINAAGNIDDLSVMLPTTGKQTGSDFEHNAVIVGGGGQLQVAAGGDIRGGAYWLGKGQGELSAGGSIKGSAGTSRYAFSQGPQLLMSGDPAHPESASSQLSLKANNGLSVAGVSDAMMVSTVSANNPVNSHFFGYTAGDALSLQSLSGDIHLNANVDRIAEILAVSSIDEQRLMSVYPPSLNVTAFNGNVQLDNDVVLYPAPASSINVFAGQAVRSAAGKMYSILMSDADPALLAGVASPLIEQDFRRTNTANLFDAALVNSADSLIKTTMHAVLPVHGADSEPARIVTRQGDIQSVLINLPKQGLIQAGRDLLDTPIQIQHTRADEASVIAAGRDLKFVASLDANGNVDTSNDLIKMELAGPGRALLKTGRDMDLGASVGLSTVGNLYNANLPAGGASLDVIVGLNQGKPDYGAFINHYLSDASGYAAERAEAVALIVDFMRQRPGNANISETAALTQFAALPANDMLPIQAPLHAVLTKVFFNELKLAGTASASDKNSGNESGFKAIDTLFPNSDWNGDLSLFYSKMQTVSGGDINLMVPGGKVNAGLSVAPSGANAKTADQLGIVVQSKGSINAFVNDDFVVNTSRVFTLDGGDILIWSSAGDIDAGKGAKSALSVTIDPPYFNAQDQLVIPAPKITNGSGIRAAATEGVDPGDVYLFAPKGVVDAGEAGIGGTNVTISATSVLGANNIQVGGIGTGVPVASTTSVAAGLTGVSNLSAGVSQMAEASVGRETSEDKKSALAKAILGILSVELLGFGE